MATLRDLVPGLDQSLAGLVPGSGPSPVQQGLRGPATALIEDEAEAAGMGQLRRGFTTGRLQADANALATDESAARAAGDTAAADALRLRIGGLQQRAKTFAPTEQDVTQLDWQPGRILDYGLATMGQGAASMTDPLAVGVGANAAAGVLGLIPHPLAQGGAKALRAGGILGGGYLNYRQNKGEFYNQAVEDPTLLAGRTAQEIDRAGTGHGVVAGALDTALPAWAANRIVPGGTKVLSGLGGGMKAALGLGGEAVTETLQGESKRGILGLLNPQRDTSGDAAERWNDAVGGAIGAAPIVGLSHLGDKANARLGVKDDTSSDDVSGGKTMPGAPKREKLTDSLKRGAAKYTDDDAAEKWNETLQGLHNPDQEVATTEQHAALLKELGGRAAKGDTVAQQHIDALNKLDPADSATWYGAPQRDAAYEHILGDGTDHEKVIEAYKGRKLNAQGGSDTAPVRLAASILSSSLPENADQALHAEAKDIARELASFADVAEGRGKLHDPLKAQGVAQRIADVFPGKTAAALVAKVATAIGVETTPLFKQLQQNLAGAADIANVKKSGRTSRAAVGDQLVALIPASKQLALRNEGIDLTSPAYKAALVDYVEQLGKAISYGATDNKGEPIAVSPSAYAKLTAKVGSEAAVAMLDMVSPGKIIEKESDAPKENGGGTTGPAKESDREGEKRSGGLGDDLEMDDFDIDAAKKSMERAPGAKLYLTKGKRGIATAGDTEGAHPFVRDKKTGNLPKLSLADDTDTKSGFNTLEAMEERAYEMLTGKPWEPLPGDDLKDMETYWTSMQKTVEEGGTKVTRRTTQELSPGQYIKNDDPKAQPVLGIGSFRIRRISAKDVMDDRGVAAGRRTTLLRQYLAQDGVLGEDDRTLTQLATLSRKIRELTDEAQPQPVKRNPQAVPLAGQGVAELEELKAQRTEVIAKLAKKIGVEAKDDATVEDLANAYFGQRFLITAEQMAEKDQLRLNQAEVLAMIRKGNQYINKSTDPTLGPSPVEVQADMNLIRFRSKSAITKSDEKRGIAVIPASELVAWVFANRNDYKGVEGGKESALEYRNALMEGIGALAEGGYMDALPFMINAEGNIERFGSKKHGGFPPSLKLGGMRQADLNEGSKRIVAAIVATDKAEKEILDKMTPKQRAKYEAAAEKKRNDEVARDQEKTEKVKNTDPDELVSEGREHNPKTAARPVAQRSLDLVPPSKGEAGPHPVLMSTPAKEAPPARYWDAPAAEPTEPAAFTNPEFDNPLGTPDRRFVGGTQIQGDLPGMPEAPGPNTGVERPYTTAVGVSRPSQKVDEKRSGRFPVAPETVETRRDNVERTQLDWDLKAQDGGVPTDFTAAQMAKAVADAALTEGETRPLTPTNATARAPALAREILWQLDSFDGLFEGKRVTSDVPADPQGAFQRIQRLVAALSRPVSTTGSRPAGGRHYAAPLALILTPANVKVLISKAQNKAAAGPRLERMRDKVARALLLADDNDLSLAGRVVAARALLGNDALTSATMKAPLKVMADREEKRQADAAADQHLEEVARKAKIAAVQQKRSAKPMQAKTEAPAEVDLFGPTPNGRRALKTASIDTLLNAREKAVNQLRYDDAGVEYNPELDTDAAVILATRVEAPPDDEFSAGVLRAIDAIDHEIKRRRGEVGTQAKTEPAKVKLNGTSAYVAKDQAKADKANKFIGRGSESSSTAQYAKDFGPAANTGTYVSTDRVFVSAEGKREGRVNPDRAELDKAVAAGVTFITDDAPNRERGYNVGERQIAKYLTENGYAETAPGEWMKTEAPAQTQRSVRDMPMNYKDGTNGMRMRPALVGKSTMDLIREGVRTATTGALERFRGLKVGDVFTVVGADDERIQVRMTQNPRPVSELTPSEWATPEGWATVNYAKYKDAWQIKYELVNKPVATEAPAPKLNAMRGPARPTRKLNAMSARIHSELGRAGFPATHDSPIRHEGRFDWREHAMKGEGAMVKGAGTYLSTSESVNKYYKGMFTAKVEPEYDYVAADRINTQFIKAVGARTEVSSDAAKIAVGKGKEEAVAFVQRTLDEHLKDGPESTISQAEFDKWTERYEKLLRAIKAMPESEMRPKRIDGFRNDKSPTYEVSVNIPQEQLLNWDKPLSEQSTKMQEVAKKVAGEGKIADLSLKWKQDADDLYTATDPDTFAIYTIQQVTPSKFILTDGIEEIVGIYSSLEQAKHEAEKVTFAGPDSDRKILNYRGEDFYRALSDHFAPGDRDTGDRQASDYLQAAGILGHRMKASAKDGTQNPNYVIYDDSKITTNYVHFNAETATKVSSDAEVAEALAMLKKTLGPKIMVEVSKDFPNAGEYLEAERLIKLSTVIGPGVLSVAYHEALHDAWANVLKNHPGAREALSKVMSSPTMLARLQDKLANEPDALAAIADGAPHAAEERVAYAYQFWAAGELDVDKPATTLFAKFRKMLRKVLGMVRESETALDIMTALHDGKLAEPSAAGRVLKEIMARETWNADVKRKFDKVIQNSFAAIAPSNDVLRRETLSGTARLLGKIMFSNPGEEAAGGDQGYLNARKQKIAQYTNYLHAALKGLSERDLAEVAKQLQLKTPLEQITYAPVRDAVKGVRALTKRYYEYATQKSPHGEPVLKLEFLGEDHYPRVWDLRKLVDDGDGQAKFIAMLLQPKYKKPMAAAMAMANAGRKVMTPVEVGMAMVRGEKINAAYTAEQIALKMYERLVEKNGVDDMSADSDRMDDELLDPFFASQKERSFKWLDDADVEPFLDKDVVSAMTRYLHQGIRAVEFSRRFGERGKFLRPLLVMKGDPVFNSETGKVEPAETHGRIASEMYESLKKAGTKGKEADLIVARHMDDVRKAVAAHEGSLGHTISPTWRKFSSAAMAYQNLRLLPLSLFAAFGDTIGIAARFGEGGGKLAFQAFTQGLRDVYARWKDAASDMPAERQKTVWENIAEMVGAVDSHMLLEQMGNAAASEFTTDWARKANRALFMANGLTAWDRSMRVSATKAAVLFLQHHASLPDKQHSARWLKELGLKVEDIPLDADGKLIYDRHVLAAEKGISLEDATKQAEKVHYAITRWVEGAVLTPTAGQRPTWASDPHYAVLFHLKQFTYSFHHTILKRAFNEAGHGNMAPIGALMMAVPTMVAADLVKGVVVGGGSLPAYMQQWDLGDHMMHGFNRAGLGGIGQFGIDGLRDPFSVLGPTVQQVSEFILNPLDIGHNLHNAVPGARYIKGLPDLARVAE